MRKLRVLWAGLGRFGLPMAEHCVAAGVTLEPLVIHGHNALGAARLEESGCRSATQVIEPGAYDVLALCLPRSTDAQSLLEELGPTLPGVVVDLTTGSRPDSASMAAKLASWSIRYVDAPVSGSPELARSGRLTVFAGAAPGWSDAGELLLHTVGERVYYFAEAGAGQAAKLVNQLIHISTLAAVCEGLTLAQAESLDLPQILDALRNSSANSQMLMRFGPSIAVGDFSPRFTVDLAMKDIEAANDAIDRLGLSFRVTPTVREILRHAQRVQLGNMDFSSMARVLSEKFE